MAGMRGCLFAGGAAFFILFGAFHIALANDSAAAIGAGGVQMVRQELVSMEKEELYLSIDKVTVAYEFRNLSDRDITTEVAFPVPEFDYMTTYGKRGHAFGDFKVIVDGQAVSHETEIKAMVGGEDVLPVLHSYGIRPETFGGYICDEQGGGADYSVNHLALGQIRDLAGRGIINDSVFEFYPKWTIVMKYHWTQTFQAHQVVSIRHEYTPVAGYALLTPEQLREWHSDACLDEDFTEKYEASKSKYASVQWIKYILTTANSWEGSIGEFTLRIVPNGDDSGAVVPMKFCWDGPVEFNEKGEAVIHMKEFVPEKDLKILFFNPIRW